MTCHAGSFHFSLKNDFNVPQVWFLFFKKMVALLLILQYGILSNFCSFFIFKGTNSSKNLKEGLLYSSKPTWSYDIHKWLVFIQSHLSWYSPYNSMVCVPLVHPFIVPEIIDYIEEYSLCLILLSFTLVHDWWLFVQCWNDHFDRMLIWET